MTVSGENNGADPAQYGPLTLAYVGDAVYELIIRIMVVRTSDEPVRILHRKTTELVKADTQSAMMRVFEKKGILTDEETAVYRRGRNAKANTHAKNADIREYRRATGFEALCGYLYLKGSTERLIQLIDAALEGIDSHFRVIHMHGLGDIIQESRNLSGEITENRKR